MMIPEPGVTREEIEQFAAADPSVQSGLLDLRSAAMVGGDEEMTDGRAFPHSEMTDAAARGVRGWIGIGEWTTQWPSASQRQVPTSPVQPDAVESGAAREPWRQGRGTRHGSSHHATWCSCWYRPGTTCVVVTGPEGLLSGDKAPKLVVECSSISLEGSAELRTLLRERRVELLAAPVSGNAKVIKAGRAVVRVLGAKHAFDAALPYLKMIAPSASYVGDGELARIVKICHNVLLGVDAVARRNHGAGAEGRRAAARVPRFHQPERDGLDVLAVQDAGVRQPRLQGDVHAASAAQGPRPRPRCGEALRGADAARSDHP